MTSPKNHAVLPALEAILHLSVKAELFLSPLLFTMIPVLFSRSVMSNSANPWTVACQAPLSIGFFQARMLEWVTFPSPGGRDFPYPGIKPASLRSPALAGYSLPLALPSGVCSNSCPLSLWYYLNSSSTTAPFSFFPSIFPSIRVFSNEFTLIR